MSLAQDSKQFLAYLEKFTDNLPVLTLEDVIAEPDQTAIISVDVINGFLYEGPLSSPRVAPIGEPIAQLMAAAWALVCVRSCSCRMPTLKSRWSLRLMASM
jgi:hypothetical protein